MDEDIERDLDELHLWLGRSISDFSSVEKALGDVYKSCFHFTDWGIAMHSYFAIKESSQRRIMTSRAVYYRLHALGNPPDALADWERLDKDVYELSRNRNGLAHGEVKASKAVGDEHFVTAVFPFSHEQPYLRTARETLAKAGNAGGSAPTGVFSPPREPFSAQDLQDFTLKCREIHERLRVFARDLG